MRGTTTGVSHHDAPNRPPLGRISMYIKKTFMSRVGMKTKGCGAMTNFSPFEELEQIAYIPDHAEGDIEHPDVEFGFVSSDRGEGGSVFCRYWLKGRNGRELRTTANSEATPRGNLRRHRSASDGEVRRVWFGAQDDKPFGREETTP